MASFLTPDVVAAVTDHMNGDHAEDNVVICRGVGGRPDVRSATMTGLDAEAVTFTVATEAGTIEDLRVPFARPVTERAQVRAEVVRMYDESVARLGLPPRTQQH